MVKTFLPPDPPSINFCSGPSVGTPSLVSLVDPALTPGSSGDVEGSDLGVLKPRGFGS